MKNYISAMITFLKEYWPAYILVIMGVCVALIVDFAPKSDQSSCIVKAQIIYAKQLEGETAEAYKLKVECGGIEQTVHTDRLFPIGSTISKKWVQQ